MIKRLRSLLGSNWVPCLGLGDQGTASDLQIAPTVELWSPTGDWEMRLEYFCASTIALIDHNAFLVFRKSQGADGYVAVLSYNRAGDLMWHDDVNEGVAINISKDNAKIVMEGVITGDKLHEIFLRYDHEARTFHIMVDGVTDVHEMDKSFQDHDFDTVQVGRWVAKPNVAGSVYLGSVSGQITEIEMTDTNNGKNSRLYNLISHSTTGSRPTFMPKAFVNHANAVDGRTFLKYQDKKGNILPTAFWEIVNNKLITVEGPDEIDEAGWYLYSLTHGFSEQQEVAWSTGGTHLDQFEPIEKKEGAQWVYQCKFYIPTTKFLESRVHLNAQIKNFGTASKVIADSRDAVDALPDPVAKLKCNLDMYPYAIPSGTRSEQATKKILLDGYSASNFDNEEATVVFHITSTDKPGKVIDVRQDTAASSEVTYGAVLSTDPSYGNAATVVIEMETQHDYHMGDVPRVSKQYVFDKSNLLDVSLDKSTWKGSDTWQSIELWDETISVEGDDE